MLQKKVDHKLISLLCESKRCKKLLSLSLSLPSINVSTGRGEVSCMFGLCDPLAITYETHQKLSLSLSLSLPFKWRLFLSKKKSFYFFSFSSFFFWGRFAAFLAAFLYFVLFCFYNTNTKRCS